MLYNIVYTFVFPTIVNESRSALCSKQIRTFYFYFHSNTYLETKTKNFVPGSRAWRLRKICRRLKKKKKTVLDGFRTIRVCIVYLV